MLQKNRKLKKAAAKVICNPFANHESTKAIKENSIGKNLSAGNSHLPKVSVYDVEKPYEILIVIKSTDMDEIPPKLIKLFENVLRKPLAIVINNSFDKGMFPDNTRIACVSPWINTLRINIL